MSQKSRKETSYGVIPLRVEDQSWKVFIVKQVHGHFWGFPKGHPDPGEEPLETAARELFEETSLLLKKTIFPHSLSENYTFIHKNVKIEKRVEYFVAEVEGTFHPHPTEIEDGGWFDLSAAVERLTFREAKRILAETIHKLPKL